MRGLTAQQKGNSVPLKASWLLAQHNRPFTEAEVFKEVKVRVLEELAVDKWMVSLPQWSGCPFVRGLLSAA